MTRYEKYKPSGIEWIGEIPEHWEVKKLKYIVALITEKANGELKKVALENIQSQTGIFIDSDTIFEGEGISFQKGDVLYGKLRPYLAKVWVAEFNGTAVGDFFVIRNKQTSNSDFMKFRLLSSSFTDIANSSTFGAKMPRVGWDFMSDLLFAIPPNKEQTSIAVYLDRKTSEIDQIIANKQKLIALYEEKKQVVINLAVTRGVETHGVRLDPNSIVRLKPSGVEWLGDIPEHWEVKKLKYVARVQTGRTPMIQGAKCDYFENGEINWFTAADFNEDGNLNNSNRKINEEALKNNEVEVFPENSIYLVSIGATLGKVGIAQGKGCANQQINIIMFNDCKVLPKYGYYIFKANKETLINEADHTTLPILNQSKTKNLLLFIPSISEQQSIIAYIEQECMRLDTIIEKCKKQIDLLKEYRTTLISEVVTGKVKVSN